MTDNQKGAAFSNRANQTTFPNWSFDDWSPTVQMPSGGLLDPATHPAWPGASSFGMEPSPNGLDDSLEDGLPTSNRWRGSGDEDSSYSGDASRWDQPFQVAGDNLAYVLRAGAPTFKPKSLQDRLSDPNIDKLKDEYGNPRGTHYLVPAPHHDYSWEILGDYFNLGLSLLAARADPELSIDAREKLAEDELANRPTEPYERIPQYGRTPTPGDRAAIGAGVGQVGDHQPTLVERWYFGDWARGEIPGYMMTPSQRAASAADRTRMRVQSQMDSNIQGGHMAAFSRQMRRQFRIGLESDD